LDELVRRRQDVEARAGAHGLGIFAAGTHARARAAGQPIVPLPRYRRMAKRLGDRVHRQIVCGLHVHVSVPDADACLRAFEGVVPWLPTLLALSANSPFAEGRPSGRRSERAVRLLEMPTGGTPPLVPDWAAWEEATAGDESRRHWDAWPRPIYGTLELRVADQQTSVRRSAGFAALAQALVATASERDVEPYDRRLYEERRERAVVDAPDPDEVAALAALVEPAARRLRGWPLVEELLAGRPEAERQLELAPRGLDAVLADVRARTTRMGAWPS